MEAPTSTLDYARRPPLRRRVLRGLMWAIIVVAAIASAWVVIPRLMVQAERVRIQQTFLENRAAVGSEPVSNLAWMGSRPGMILTNARTPGLKNFTTWAGPQARQVAAYAGGRDAGGGDRVVLIYVTPILSANPQALATIDIEGIVYEPGGWTVPPRILTHFTTTLPVPVDGDERWAMRVYPGAPDPRDPAAFDVPLATGYAGQPGVRVWTLRGRLLKNDSLRFEILPSPTDSE